MAEKSPRSITRAIAKLRTRAQDFPPAIGATDNNIQFPDSRTIIIDEPNQQNLNSYRLLFGFAQDRQRIKSEAQDEPSILHLNVNIRTDDEGNMTGLNPLNMTTGEYNGVIVETAIWGKIYQVRYSIDKEQNGIATFDGVYSENGKRVITNIGEKTARERLNLPPAIDILATAFEYLTTERTVEDLREKPFILPNRADDASERNSEGEIKTVDTQWGGYVQSALEGLNREAVDMMKNRRIHIPNLYLYAFLGLKPEEVADIEPLVEDNDEIRCARLKANGRSVRINYTGSNEGRYEIQFYEEAPINAHNTVQRMVSFATYNGQITTFSDTRVIDKYEEGEGIVSSGVVYEMEKKGEGVPLTVNRRIENVQTDEETTAIPLLTRAIPWPLINKPVEEVEPFNNPYLGIDSTIKDLPVKLFK